MLASLVAALSVAPAARAQTTPSDYFGANIQALIRQGFVKPAGWGPYLSSMSSAGLGVARFDGPWSWVEPVAPKNGVHTYTWDQLDEVVAALAKANLRWLPVLDFLPRWVGPPMMESSYPDFAAFAAAIARRYGRGGEFWTAHPELPAMEVHDYEVWNEANSAHFWEAVPDPAAYAKLVIAVHDAIHAVEPQAEVLASIGWQNAADFVGGMFANGVAGHVDGIAYHPYAPTMRGVLSLIKKMRATLTAGGQGQLPIHLTEIGWPRVPQGPGATHAWDGPVSDPSRAATMSLTADALARSDCNVHDFIVYSLVEEEKSATNLEDWLGLLTRNNGPTAAALAMTAASARWVEDGARQAVSGPSLHLCGSVLEARLRQPVASAAVASAGLLPLQLGVVATPGQACLGAIVNYFGNPLEEASVFVRDAAGRRTGVLSDATGQGQLCPDPARANAQLLAWAELPRVARSATFSCTAGACRPLDCRVPTVRAARSARVSRRGRATLKLAVRCATVSLAHEPLSVAAVGRGGRARVIRSAWSRAGTLKLALRVKRGRDRALRVVFRGDDDLNLPPISRRVALRYPRTARR